MAAAVAMNVAILIEADPGKAGGDYAPCLAGWWPSLGLVRPSISF